MINSFFLVTVLFFQYQGTSDMRKFTCVRNGVCTKIFCANLRKDPLPVCGTKGSVHNPVACTCDESSSVQFASTDQAERRCKHNGYLISGTGGAQNFSKNRESMDSHV